MTDSKENMAEDLSEMGFFKKGKAAPVQGKPAVDVKVDVRPEVKQSVSQAVKQKGIQSSGIDSELLGEYATELASRKEAKVTFSLRLTTDEQEAIQEFYDQLLKTAKIPNSSISKDLLIRSIAIYTIKCHGVEVIEAMRTLGVKKKLI